MADCATNQMRFDTRATLALEAAFDGGRITSDGGLVWLSEMGLCEVVSESVPEWRKRRGRHSLASLVRQRVFQIACGYEDQNDSNCLREDPLLKVLCGSLPESGTELASQPTISRMENAASRRCCYRIARAIFELYLRERANDGARVEHIVSRLLPSFIHPHNKALVRRFLDEVYNRGNLNVADELLAADYVDHTVPPGKYAGREGLKRSVAKQRASSSDLHITIEEQIAQGDKVVSWVIGSGTHDRESFMGLAPTRARMMMKHIFISRVLDSRIVEQWGVSDISSVWQQRLQRERIERERTEQDLRVARTIQQANLPNEVPQLEGWQVAPYCQPAREVGGDFYDFHELSEGGWGLWWEMPQAKVCQRLY